MIWGGRERRRRLNIWCGRDMLFLERNWRLKHRELDVICLKGDLLVVVEVKTRDLPEEHPEELLDYRKRRNIRIATDAYIKKRKGFGLRCASI